jgi:hypothetical protein
VTESQPVRPTVGLRYGLAFALIAALLLLQPLCTTTYIKLFYERGGQLIQPVPPEGVPLPRALAWSPSTVNLIERLGPLPLAGVLGWNISLACLLAYGLLRILNPTFRMTTGVDWDKTLLSRTYIHTRPLIKAFLIVVTAFLPLAIIWHLLGLAFGPHGWVLALRMTIIGAATWALLSRDGVAGDYESGNYGAPAGGGVLASQLLRGAAAGVVVALTILYGPGDPSSYYFDFFRTLGGIAERQWWLILGASLGFVGAITFAVGGVLVSLGRPGWDLSQRGKRGLGFLAILVVALLTWNRWQPAWLASRYDYTPNSRISAPELLARKSGVGLRPPGGQQVFIVSGGEASPLQFTGQSVVELDASPEAAARIRMFLERRGYTTSLALPAYVTLMDSEALVWSSEGALQVALLNLEHGADPAYARNFLEKLSMTAATPEVIRMAERFSSDDFMTFPDRKALAHMGDLFAQIGQRKRAEQFYRRAAMPASQVVERAMERTMFAEGRVGGRILWNGKPLPGTKVGIVPAQAMLNLRRQTSPDGMTSPFWLWNVAASGLTSSTGDFSLEHVVAGNYYLIIEAPDARPMKSEDIVVSGAPRNILVNFATKEIKLGAVEIRTKPAAGQTRP